MEYHEVCEMFPPLCHIDFIQLMRDIDANGLREPIWTFKGKIIDGRNRYMACEQLRIEPKFREWEGEEEDLLAFVASQNLHRRHLTTGQKGVIGQAIEKRLKEEARQRKLAGNKKGGKTAGKSRPKIDDSLPLNSGASYSKKEGESSTIAAKIVGVSHDTIQKLNKIEKVKPELIEEIKNNNTTVHAAYTQITTNVDDDDEVDEQITDNVSLTRVQQLMKVKKRVREYCRKARKDRIELFNDLEHLQGSELILSCKNKTAKLFKDYLDLFFNCAPETENCDQCGYSRRSDCNACRGLGWVDYNNYNKITTEEIIKRLKRLPD